MSKKAKKSVPFDKTARLKKAAFLAAFAIEGNITGAAEKAGTARTDHYRWMEDPDYAAAFRDAEKTATDLMVREAKRRAVEGCRKLKFHDGQMICVPAFDAQGVAMVRPILDAKGKPVIDEVTGKPMTEPVMVPYVEHEYSDTLMIFLLKARDPAVFREKFEHKIGGEIGLGIKLYGIVAPVEDV